MRTRKAKLICLCTLIVCTLCSCGKLELKGKWNATFVIEKERSYSIERHAKRLGRSLSDVKFTADFQDDGVLKAHYGGVDISGTYSVSGDKVYVKLLESEEVWTLTEKDLRRQSNDFSEAVWVFEKED